jgi:hypothetical protein
MHLVNQANHVNHASRQVYVVNTCFLEQLRVYHMLQPMRLAHASTSLPLEALETVHVDEGSAPSRTFNPHHEPVLMLYLCFNVFALLIKYP